MLSAPRKTPGTLRARGTFAQEKAGCFHADPYQMRHRSCSRHREPMLLHEFLVIHRGQILSRVRERVAKRRVLLPTEQSLETGVPLFLTHLGAALERKTGSTQAIVDAASQHGTALLLHGVTDSQVAEFCSRWGLVEFSLFGSVLGPDFRPDSDVDVLIRYRPDRVPRLGDLVDMREDLEILFGRAVDLVSPAAPQRFAGRGHHL